VIKGMLAAIGLILILKQAPVLVGWQEGNYNLGVAAIGVATVLFLLLWEKVLQPRLAFARLVPGALVAVVFAVLINTLVLRGTELEIASNFLVSLPFDGSLSGFFSGLKSPDWSGLSTALIWKTAITIALVASLETLLSLDAADK